MVKNCFFFDMKLFLVFILRSEIGFERFGDSGWVGIVWFFLGF